MSKTGPTEELVTRLMTDSFDMMNSILEAEEERKHSGENMNPIVRTASTLMEDIRTFQKEVRQCFDDHTDV